MEKGANLLPSISQEGSQEGLMSDGLGQL